MISFSKLGRHGNLGNQLFEIASTIGIAMKHGVPYVFPRWEHAKYFEFEIPQSNKITFDYQVDEVRYQFDNLLLDRGRNVDLLGWFQTEKYWLHCEAEVLKHLKFKDSFVLKCIKEHEDVFKRDARVCAISVRRGDYVGNENYEQLDMKYYSGAAAEMVKRVGEVNFLVFSDDVEWCRKNFTFKPENTFFTSSKVPIEQLATMSFCDHFIIANSSFSWWGAYLGEKFSFKKNTVVIAPAKWNAGKLLDMADDRDVIPDRWVKYFPEVIPLAPFANTPGSAKGEAARWDASKKYDLRDVTFTIPVKMDSKDRKENVDLTIKFLQHYFDTNITIGEMDEEMKFDYVDAGAINGGAQNFVPQQLPQQTIEYRFWKKEKLFKRTWMLNQMAREAQTPFVVNWDADVFVNPEQIVAAVEKLRSGEYDGVYPYDGRFFRVHRNTYAEFNESLDVAAFKKIPYPKWMHNKISYGGAVMWNKEKFFEGGGENENLQDYGPEDFERYERFTKLDFRMGRISGALFHIDHADSHNGSQGHERYQFNHQEHERLKNLRKEILQREVNHWEWMNYSLSMMHFPKPKRGNHILWRKLYANAIYLINLQKRPDKLEHAREQLDDLKLDEVMVYPGIDGFELQLKSKIRQLSSGMMGCYRTHQEIIRKALETGMDCIVLLEDDIQFIPGFNEFLELAFLQLPVDWEFIYLGAEEYGGLLDYKEKINDMWVVPKSVWGTQAYAIRGRKAMIRILNLLELQKMQLDNQLSQLVLPKSGLKYYMLFPPAVNQWRHESSDVQVANPELNFSA